jgi:hypothetical protein
MGDADPAADQNDALGVLACEIEGAVRRFDLDLVTLLELVMQPARHQAMVLALHGDFDVIAPRRRGGNGVRALGGDASRRDVERQELSGQIVEGDLGTVGWPEAECLDVVGHVLLLGEHELAEPSQFTGGLVVLEVARRAALQQRRLWQDLDLLLARSGRREAFAEFQQQARVALDLDLSADESQRKTLLMREEAEPGLSICRDAKVRLAEQTVLDVEGTVPDL